MQASQLQFRQTNIDECVEYLCEQGCMKVTGYIKALKSHRDLPELACLSTDERSVVLHELVSIMSVYQGTCSR